MQIQLVYNKKKVLQALRYHFISRPEIKILSIFIILFSLLSGFFLFQQKIKPEIFLLSSLIWVTFFIIIFYLLPHTIYNKSKDIFTHNYTVHFLANGMRLSSTKGSTEWSWNRFSNFYETPHFFHLYFSKRSFFLIPKENMNEIEQYDIRILLSKHIRIGKI